MSLKSCQNYHCVLLHKYAEISVLPRAVLKFSSREGGGIRGRGRFYILPKIPKRLATLTREPNKDAFHLDLCAQNGQAVGQRIQQREAVVTMTPR
jgi:hypothetical protein